jgi:hypothetical protein
MLEPAELEPALCGCLQVCEMLAKSAWRQVKEVMRDDTPANKARSRLCLGCVQKQLRSALPDSPQTASKLWCSKVGMSPCCRWMK